MVPYLPVWKQYFSGAYRIYPLFHRARGDVTWGGPGETYKARGYVTMGGPGETVLVFRTHSPLIPLHATSLVCISFMCFFINISFGCLKSKIRKVFSGYSVFSVYSCVYFFTKSLAFSILGSQKRRLFTHNVQAEH